MALERTLSIIKPDGVEKNLIGQVYARFEKAGLRIVAARMRHLTLTEAEGFYANIIRINPKHSRALNDLGFDDAVLE